MFQNCLTMLHTTVPTIWMDTALWVSCSAYLSGIGIKYLIIPFLLAIVCGRKKNNEDLILSGWAVFRIPYKKCTGVSNSFKPKYNRGVHYTCTPLLYFTQPLENKFLKKYRIKKKHPKRCSHYFQCYLWFNSSKRITIRISFHQ